MLNIALYVLLRGGNGRGGGGGIDIRTFEIKTAFTLYVKYGAGFAHYRQTYGNRKGSYMSRDK